jgi:hypothetical protein
LCSKECGLADGSFTQRKAPPQYLYHPSPPARNPKLPPLSGRRLPACQRVRQSPLSWPSQSQSASSPCCPWPFQARSYKWVAQQARSESLPAICRVNLAKQPSQGMRCGTHQKISFSIPCKVWMFVFADLCQCVPQIDRNPVRIWTEKHVPGAAVDNFPERRDLSMCTLRLRTNHGRGLFRLASAIATVSENSLPVAETHFRPSGPKIWAFPMHIEFNSALSFCGEACLDKD